jgi:large subunit ribosomal protein L4
MQLDVIGAKPVTVSDDVFGKEFREDLVHQVVVAYRNAGRAGTKKQKSRSDMSGTTKKFKKQKGGGARHGDYRAPIFVGGGVTFAARPRSFAQKVNKKMYRGAFASILSELIRQGRLKVVDSFGVEQPKTKGLVGKLGELKVSGRVVLIAENAPEALFLAARNVPYVHVVDTAALDPVSLVGADHVVMTVESVKRVEEWLS